MTHTSTEQPEALRLADWLKQAVQTYPQVSEDEAGGYWTEQDQVMDFAADELRRLHARVQELEASQAQRAPLALYQRDTIKANAWRETMTGGYWDANAIIDGTEAAHGITQEKQG